MFRRLCLIRLAIRLYRIFRQLGRLEAKRVPQKDIHALYAEAGRSIRIVAEELCGVIVKAGQFLSLREELFPEAFTSELKLLQEDVPPVSFDAIRGIVEAELGRPLIDAFETFEASPDASASLAQVHRARLKSGEVVAVKVLRPGIERIVRSDMATLGMLARVFNRIPKLRQRVDMAALHQAFAETLAGEVNLRSEADHMRRFADAIGDASLIVIPAVLDAYTTRRVLVMQYISGAKVTDAAQLDAWRVDRAPLRDALIRIYLQQIFVAGFVHLDPHPGNLRILPNGRLAMLDFGMIGEYTEAERRRMRRLVQHVLLGDKAGVAGILQELGFVRAGTDVVELARGIGAYPGAGDGLNGALIRSVIGHPAVRVEARYLLLIRCLGLLKTVLTMLTPDETDWLGVVSDQAMAVLWGNQASGVLS